MQHRVTRNLSTSDFFTSFYLPLQAGKMIKYSQYNFFIFNAFIVHQK